MDIAQIRKLIKLIQSSDVTEIEITEGETSVRISRQGTVATVAAPVITEHTVALAPVAAAVAAAATEESSSEHQVTSPMVGTYYAAASPDANDFVKVGQKIKTGDTLCIIEAMKMMNEIEAEYDGVIEEILVANASPLEYGQAIFVINPNG